MEEAARYQWADLAMDTMASALLNRAVWETHLFPVAEGVAQENRVVFLDLDGENETIQAKAAVVVPAVPACMAAEPVLELYLGLSAKVTHEGPWWKTGDLVYVKNPFAPIQDPAKLLAGGLASVLPAHEMLTNATSQGQQALVYLH